MPESQTHKIIVRPREHVIVIRDASGSVKVRAEQPSVTIVHVGKQGPAGGRGPSGPSGAASNEDLLWWMGL